MVWMTSTATSGTCSTDTAGTSHAGIGIATAGIKPGSLSCLHTVLAETSTLTLSAKWQVSYDNSTWYDMANEPQNPAAVAITTGTAGADAAVSKVVPCPSGFRGWKFVRPAVVTGVTTGTTADTYAMTSYYEKASGFDG